MYCVFLLLLFFGWLFLNIQSFVSKWSWTLELHCKREQIKNIWLPTEKPFASLKLTKIKKRSEGGILFSFEHEWVMSGWDALKLCSSDLLETLLLIRIFNWRKLSWKGQKKYKKNWANSLSRCYFFIFLTLSRTQKHSSCTSTNNKRRFYILNLDKESLFFSPFVDGSFEPHTPTRVVKQLYYITRKVE